MSRWLALACLGCIVAVGATLRLDALSGRYGIVDHPGWFRALQRAAVAATDLSGSPLGTWAPEPEYPHQNDAPSRYRSDPYTYLLRAREMRGFYGAHFREPVFPYAVKGALWLLDGQDVAVSLTSLTFSVLCTVATYLLGAMAFSRGVGLIAALGLAVESDAISWGVWGWRDDAYACAVVLVACLVLRQRRAPSTWGTVALGVAMGLSTLTRIFTVTFAGPALLYLLARAAEPWHARWRHAALTAGVATLIVAPYLINCWRVFGDPLYTLNYQPISYVAWEGATLERTPGAVEYITNKLVATPFQTLDTAVLGMTSYPFLNKWAGFDAWFPGLGAWLSWTAMAGLLLMTWSQPGRLLWLIWTTAQVPFSFTWKLSWDWRYTFFTYPFLLIAMALALTSGASLLQPAIRRRLAGLARSRRAWIWPAASGVAVGAITAAVVYVLPVAVARETLATSGSAVIEAGPRDPAFFRAGWSAWFRTGNITTRAATGPQATIDLPSLEPRAYRLTLRLNPYPAPPADVARLPSVHVFFNHQLLRTVALTWDPERVGTFDLQVPESWVQSGTNRLVFAPAPSADQAAARREPSPSGFQLWYVWIQPVAGDTRHPR